MKLSNVWLCLSSGSSLLNVSKESHTILVILSLLKEMFSINCFVKLLERDLSDTELLRVATATALPPSRPSSPVQHLTNQFSTAQISSYPNTATTSPVARPFYTSGPHIPVKFQHAMQSSGGPTLFLLKTSGTTLFPSCPLTSLTTSVTSWTA